MNDIQAIEECVEKSTTHMEEMKEELLASIEAFTKATPGIMDIVTGVTNLGSSFKTLGEIANSCESNIKDSKEMEVFFEMTDIFTESSAKDIALKVGSNVFVSGVDIYRELSAGYTNFFAKQYHQFGVDIGSAFALVFIGPAAVNKLSDDDQNKLKSMIDSQVWPGMDKNVFDDEDGEEYREVLFSLFDARQGIDTDMPEVPDVIIDTVPEMRDVDKSEFEDMLDGEFYYDAQEAEATLY